VGFETDQLTIIGDTWCWPSKIKPKLDECNKRLKQERNRAEEELTMKKDRFVEELDEYQRQAEAFSAVGEIERTNDTCSALTTLQEKMAEAKARAEAMNGEEELLGQVRSTFDQLEAVPRILAPYLSLWMNAQEFRKNSYMWLNGPMGAIDPEVLESEVGTLRRETIKSVKFFENDESGELKEPLKAAEKLKGEIEAFRVKLPLISCVCNKGMRERHWKDVSEIIGFEFKPTETTTLQSTLGLSLEKHLEALEEIAGSAAKEYSLEKVRDDDRTSPPPLAPHTALTCPHPSSLTVMCSPSPLRARCLAGARQDARRVDAA
jgi:dynein heavy chain